MFFTNSLNRNPSRVKAQCSNPIKGGAGRSRVGFFASLAGDNKWWNWFPLRTSRPWPGCHSGHIVLTSLYTQAHTDSGAHSRTKARGPSLCQVWVAATLHHPWSILLVLSLSRLNRLHLEKRSIKHLLSIWQYRERTFLGQHESTLVTVSF